MSDRYSHWSLSEGLMSSPIANDYYCSDFCWNELAGRVAASVSSTPIASSEKLEKFMSSRDVGRDWELFYKRHDNANVYKPRRYLPNIWPDLVEKDCPAKLLLEIGCGYGSSILPLLQFSQSLCAVGTDISTVAIERLKKFPMFDLHRCKAFVHDITTQPIEAVVDLSSVDVVLLIFALSAMSPVHHAHVIQQAARALKPGGCLLFRDYGLYDMSQIRSTQRIGQNWYARQDGTLTYFFSKNELSDLAVQAGLTVEDNEYHTVANFNRKANIRLERVFLTARFRKPHDLITVHDI